MNFILQDIEVNQENLKPFTFIRAISDIRVGILTISEKWEKYLGKKVKYKTVDYLQTKYPFSKGDNNIFINSIALPNQNLVKAIENLPPNTRLSTQNNVWLASHQKKGQEIKNQLIFKYEVNLLEDLPSIFALNGQEIQSDFDLLTKGRVSEKIIDPHTVVYNPENVFIEKGVSIKASIINAENAKIYLGKNTKVSAGSIIEGNFALCEGATLNIGAKMRGDTTIGPLCKVGGEISNSVFFAHSNKGHEGFLGNSIVGEWCNFGADTNCSNLKNNYSNIKIWNYERQDFVDTKRQFCGLMMGDFSKTGINTMFNTGTVVGVFTNIFGGDFPPKYIPSFSWGGSKGFDTYNLEKAIETSRVVMKRRKKELSKVDENIIKYLFEKN